MEAANLGQSEPQLPEQSEPLIPEQSEPLIPEQSEPQGSLKEDLLIIKMGGFAF